MSTATESWGPTVQGRARRRGPSGRRVVAWLLVLVVVVPLLFGVALLLYASARIERIPVDNLAGGGSPLHILVVGNDSREGLTREQRRELSTGSAPGNRTDTIFVMTIEGGDVGLLAFPRDLFVPLCNGEQARINAAFAVGGPGCLVRTVRQVSGIPISHFLSVSFGGFVGIVDAVGGVEMCLEQAIADRDAGIDLPAGCQTLDGEQALGYVRVRKIDSDLERIKRQQEFLRALADEILSPATLLNPVALVDTTGQIAEALTADESMGVIDLARIAIGMRGMATGDVVTRTVPTTPATVGGAAVLTAVEAEAVPLYEAFRTGAILERADRGVQRSDVQVRVLNGTDIAGLAGRTAEALRKAGYVVTGVGNAETTQTTVIRFPRGQRAEAELLAADVPGGAALERTPDLAVVTLILGSDTGTPG